MMSSDEYREMAKEAQQAALTALEPAVRARAALDWLNMAALANGQAALERAVLAAGVDEPSNQNTPGPPKDG
jgi:hypothetical protein